MVMWGGCGILLSEGFAVSLGHRKVSDLDFSCVGATFSHPALRRVCDCRAS